MNTPNAYEHGVREAFGEDIIPKLPALDGAKAVAPLRRVTGRRSLLLLAVIVAVAGCEAGGDPSATPPGAGPTGPGSSAPPRPSLTPIPSRTEGRGEVPVLVGDPIDIHDLSGRIVFDDFEDVFAMNIDGSEYRVVAGLPGAEFDGVWSPDGAFIAYRDSRRGVNEDDEIYVVAADGSGARNLTQNPANDWGADWSPDGQWIIFNSDRDGFPLRGYLANVAGTEIRRVETDVWFEYPSFSPDGRHVVMSGHDGSDYDLYIVELATGQATQLTDSPGDDNWPVWSPDGATIAFTTERDDCLRTAPGADCWRTEGGQPGEHQDVWLMDIDGSNQRRVTPEISQFVAWSPDSQYLLVSGHALFVIRPDGTGRLEIRSPGSSLPAGGIPDWID